MPNVIAINAAAKKHIDAARATSDEMLLARIAKNDRTSMHTLYARHNVRVYRFAAAHGARHHHGRGSGQPGVSWTSGAPRPSSRAARRSRPGCCRSPASRR